MEYITSRRLSSGYVEKEENLNWFFAVGGYRSWGKGVAKVCGTRFTLKFKYKFSDYYNWDKGKFITFLGIGISDDFMGSFHRKGLGKEFKMIGEITKEYSWEKGGAID